jgi:hypothetical protein
MPFRGWGSGRSGRRIQASEQLRYSLKKHRPNNALCMVIYMDREAADGYNARSSK